MNMLSESQMEIIKFYEGDVKQTEDPILSDAKAYVTWNALFFSSAESECARAYENRRLNPAFLKEPERVIDMSRILLSCMSKAEKDIVVKRVDRLADYQCFLREERFESFISTSTAGFLNAYQNKAGLVLMNIRIPKGTMCIDFSAVLDSYQKKDEKEILLPPYLSICTKDLEMDPSILSIRDRNGETPKVYCEITAGTYLRKKRKKITLTQDIIDASVRYYDALNHHGSFSKEDENKYLLYKHYFQYRIQEWMDTYE